MFYSARPNLFENDIPVYSIFLKSQDANCFFQLPTSVTAIHAKTKGCVLTDCKSSDVTVQIVIPECIVKKVRTLYQTSKIAHIKSTSYFEVHV